MPWNLSIRLIYTRTYICNSVQPLTQRKRRSAHTTLWSPWMVYSVKLKYQMKMLNCQCWKSMDVIIMQSGCHRWDWPFENKRWRCAVQFVWLDSIRTQQVGDYRNFEHSWFPIVIKTENMLEDRQQKINF